MPAEMYVIKPRCEALANGVIVVARSDLDTVLNMILEPATSLKNNPDKKYAYWVQNKDDTFLIEKYYTSDYISFCPPGSEKEYLYDAAMRLAFILKYEGGKASYHCLGGFWKLPAKALDEEGTLNEKTISYCHPPFYKAIEPALLKEVNAQMEKAMLLFIRLCC